MRSIPTRSPVQTAMSPRVPSSEHGLHGRPKTVPLVICGALLLVAVAAAGCSRCSEIRDWARGKPARPPAVSVDREPFWVWAAGDAHIQADLLSDYESLAASAHQVREATGAPDPDVWVNPGDFVGRGHCPGSEHGKQLRNQLQSVDRHRMYAVAGNHDANSADMSWFRTYVDPTGRHRSESGVEREKRPFPTRGAWDHYAFRAGNAVFLMLSDRNAGPPPFGRKCGAGGPAGRYSRETFEWWVDQVEAHRDEIVVTVAHHALLRTTTYTDYGEGAEHAHDRADRGSWADERGASIVYAIGEETIDGRNAAGASIGERDYGFKTFIREHPGAVDLWISGHTHRELHPGAAHDGRGLVEEVHGTWFVNAGALTRKHAAPEVPFSRMIGFRPGSEEVEVRTFLHADGWKGTEKGLYEEAAERISVEPAFRPGGGERRSDAGTGG